jgi:hypothetical protein
MMQSKSPAAVLLGYDREHIGRQGIGIDGDLVQVAELGVAFNVATSFILFLFSLPWRAPALPPPPLAAGTSKGVASFHRRGLSKTLSAGLDWRCSFLHYTFSPEFLHDKTAIAIVDPCGVEPTGWT